MPNDPLFVVPVDFSPDTEATVSAAFAVARTCGAHVHLLEVVSPRGPSHFDFTTGSQFRGRVTPKRDWSRLAALIHAAERRRMHVETVAYRGEASKTIHAYVQLTKATLLVIGKHYGTPRWRRSPRIAGSLTRSSSVPVLVLPPQRRSPELTSLEFSHVVSAVDFTVASAVAVRTVFDVIRRTGARLTLVHALPATSNMVFSGGEAIRAARNLLGQTSHAAERLRKKIPSDVRMRVDARVTTGDPHRRILDVASEVKGDLIVMGVAPRNRLDEVLFGSTVRNVLRMAKIPVLMIPVPAGAYKWLEEKDSIEVARR
jgi:nucleotide-binding universal stress UspA family protein